MKIKILSENSTSRVNHLCFNGCCLLNLFVAVVPSSFHFSNVFFFSLFLQEKENDEKLLQRLLFTSTPRQSHSRRSSLPRFESINSMRLTESISKSNPKLTADFMTLGDLTKDLFAKPHTPKVQWSFDQDGKSSDSTPDCSRRDKSSRKSCARKRRSSLLAKKSFRMNSRKEKRHAVYNQTRRMSKVENVIDETFSLAGSIQTAGTYSIAGSVQSAGTNFGSEYEEIEIRNFQAEINERQGLLEISTEQFVESIEDQDKFEKFCHNKASDCPFDHTKTEAEKPLVTENQIGRKSSEKLRLSASPPRGMASRISSHCARICWNQQKIPQLQTYKAERRNESVKNRSSVSSTHSILFSSITSLNTSIVGGWHELPTFVQYYMIAITLCFISIVHYQFSR